MSKHISEETLTEIEASRRDAFLNAVIEALGPLIEEVRELRAAAEWRPIETAPKDGTPILSEHGLIEWRSVPDFGPDRTRKAWARVGGGELLETPKFWKPWTPPQEKES